MGIEQILNTYSLSDIIIVMVFLASAIMGIIRFGEFVYERTKKLFDKGYQTEAQRAETEARLVAIETKADSAAETVDKLTLAMGLFSDRLEILVDSDKDSIKAYLTDKHHYYVFSQKWIDDYNLDCIERRYVHYKKAGGNSFVDHLMEELRLLPTQPPKNEE